MRATFVRRPRGTGDLRVRPARDRAQRTAQHADVDLCRRRPRADGDVDHPGGRCGSATARSPAAGVAMLSPPLVLSVALAVGMRILMTIPVDLPARWVFQTTGARCRAASTPRCTRRAAAGRPAGHAPRRRVGRGCCGARRSPGGTRVFCACLTLVLCEVLLGSFSGAPMTRPYVPGRSRFHMLWALYLTAFTTYCYTLAGLEAHAAARRRAADRLGRVRVARVRVLAQAQVQAARSSRKCPSRPSRSTRCSRAST